MMDRGSTVDRARGRWRQILPALGIDSKYLKNRHGPCPLCGGYDRFRFDDKQGNGTYFCNQCGAGTGIILVRKRNDWDYATACRRIDELIGGVVQSVPVVRSTNSPDKRQRAIDQLISESTSPNVVSQYLTRRGLTARSTALLGNARCPHYGDQGAFTGNFAAVIAPIVAPDGKIESLHRIYDAPVSPRKKILPPVRTINGAAVRLFEAGQTLAIAEGVETGLAVHQMTGLPVWALINAGNFAEWTPPEGVRAVHVFGDNDRSYTGQGASYALARRLTAKGLAVEVHIPILSGTDWLDELIKKGAL